MELIPIEHKISKEVQQNWELAELYENAGLKTKAIHLKGACFKRACKENNIPVIKGFGSGNIYEWRGHDWNTTTLYRCGVEIEVPVPILKKMAEIKDKRGLYIALPDRRNLPDPVLLWELPYHPDELWFIELARWE